MERSCLGLDTSTSSLHQLDCIHTKFTITSLQVTFAKHLLKKTG